MPPIVNAMSIDVEDYFHANALSRLSPSTAWEGFEQRAERNTHRMLDVLDEHGVKATCFVLGWVAERYPSIARRIVADGHELASHGYWHQLIFAIDREAFRSDIRRGKALLEDQAGVRVHGYRAPSFSVVTRTLWALDELLDAGFTYDASIFPIRHDTYGIPDAPRHPHAMASPSGRPIFEIPSSTTTLGRMNLPVAGGGYFRLLPYAWTRWGIGRVNRGERRPVVFYLHPWDMDPGQPRFDVSGLSRVRHYTNLERCEPRYRRLLSQFAFAPIRDVFPAALGAAA